MDYQSTRNSALTADSAQAVLQGIAPDGGLYIADPAKLDFDWKAALECDARGMSERILHALLPDFPDMKGIVERSYKDKFETVKVAEPLLGTVGEDATVVNSDKEAAAQAVVAEAVAASDYDSLEDAAADGTAFVFLGHGTSHDAAVTYDQMQEQMKQLGYENVFVGTVEGKPEDTAFPAVKKALQDAGYTKVILRPLMVVAGDHANNDMAGDEEGSWYYGMVNGGEFEVEGADEAVDTGAGLTADNVTCQIEGLGRIADIQKIYLAHTADAMAAE